MTPAEPNRRALVIRDGRQRRIPGREDPLHAGRVLNRGDALHPP
jgi:hypothetical protein